MTEVDDLKYFVAVFFDGSVQRCLELDELLWRVRLANRHEPKTWGPLPPPAPSPDEILKELENDLFIPPIRVAPEEDR